MEYLGLIFEFIIFFGAVYVYLLCRGLIAQSQQNPFIQKNKGILRILSIGLIAIMGLNITIHLMQLFGS